MSDASAHQISQHNAIAAAAPSHTDFSVHSAAEQYEHYNISRLLYCGNFVGEIAFKPVYTVRIY